MRKLSSIQKVDKVSAVENSDNLDVIDIRGWKVVTKRGELKEGDLCVYFEIDSVVPPMPQFEFLRNRGYRIKTIKLRGQISQGLVLPIDNFAEYIAIEDIEIGKCLDKILGVVHVDESKETNLNGSLAFPSYIRKTDQERIQNLLLDKVVNRSYEISIKLDGSSMTVFYCNGEYGICSRNRRLLDNDNSKFDQCNKKYRLVEILSQYCVAKGRNLAVQGELIGDGIQGNKEKIKGYEWYVYDIWDIDTQRYLSPRERFMILTQLNFESVPILNESFYLKDTNVKSYQYLLDMADGPSLNAKMREGIVFKSSDGQFSFKVINNKWLLKN